MAHTTQPHNTPLKSNLVIRSSLDAGDSGVETEIAAAVTIAPDGGWGWVVAFASFGTIFIIGGITLSFGPLLPDICKDLGISTSQAALVNSLLIAVYLLCSPISSALINRFGFRTMGMTGGIICSLSCFGAYFSSHYAMVILMYSIGSGFGVSLAYMSASLIVGFYFERLRYIVMPLSSAGYSVGPMVMNPTYNKTVALGGWRTTVLLQSSLYGIIYFLSMTFRPLTSLTIVATDEDEGPPTRTVTYLPNMAAISRHDSTVMQATKAERAMNAISNFHFPTAANLVESTRNPPIETAGAGPSTKATVPGVSRITLKAQNAAPNDEVRLMKSIMSTKNIKDAKQKIEITIEVQEKPQKKTYFGRALDWQTDPTEARPMYRDDAFYDGKINTLPAYQKSTKELSEEQRTGLEYQLEVSRAVTVDDLNERRGVCTTAVRRILVTMLDPYLMKKNSFLMFCLATLLFASGTVVPYVFLQSRGLANGMDPVHCQWLVSVLSFFNLWGRLASTALAAKLGPGYVCMIGMAMSGISTMFSTLSYSPFYQYSYCAVYGLAAAMAACLRSLVIVDTYGLENLTNAWGISLMFNGIANLYSTPLCAFFAKKLGYNIAFYICGAFMLSSAMAMFAAIRVMRPIEKKMEDEEKLEKPRSKREMK